jgi:hypothetical protein
MKVMKYLPDFRVQAFAKLATYNFMQMKFGSGFETFYTTPHFFEHNR